jgi:protein-S-isoprenylcysteine O-methyltransferase Ste14
MSQAPPPPTQPTIGLRVGGRDHSISGGAALAVVAAVLLGLLALLVGTYRAHAWSFRSLFSPMAISAGLWILFILYWGAAAKNTAATKSAESARSRGLHQLMLNGALVLAFWPVPGLGGRWLPAAPYLAPLGLALQAGCGLLGAWARRHLGRNWSGAITAKVDHQLVRSGPYRRLRHPIYTAMLGMFLGTALVSGRLHGVVALALISFAYARKIPLEERNLRQVFGAAYDDYRRESWAVIPGLV